MRTTRHLALALSLPVTLTGCCSTNHEAPTDPALVVIVKFRSQYDADEIRRRYPKRMPQFRALDGLMQKYYLHDDKTDEWCGVYLWDSAEAAQHYLQSDLKKSIPEAYGVVGTPRVEAMKVEDVLRR